MPALSLKRKPPGKAKTSRPVPPKAKSKIIQLPPAPRVNELLEELVIPPKSRRVRNMAAPAVVPFPAGKPTTLKRQAAASEARERQARMKESIDQTARTLDELEAKAAAFKSQIAPLEAKYKETLAEIDRIENQTLQEMQAAGTKQWIGNLVTLTVRENAPALKVDNESLIPEQFIRVKEIREADKLQIKAALARGEEIAGVHLVQTLTLLRKGA